jgi:selenocysteine-specific elongation factor
VSKAPHAVVLGTAGHIDHGKTTLVRALTGIDTDRLPEEKRRGITIELGFAPWKVAPDLEASIVDVPGHEGFVRTMVAGAGGIDTVLLVVSAEDGVMPQTREHIQVCRLLAVPAGVVALTKIDRLAGDADAIELAVDDVRTALAGTPFADAPIVPCSATTGDGLELLRKTVVDAVARVPRRDALGDPILPVDRVFTIKGHGTVVTGTLMSGAVDLRNDEDFVLVPHGEQREPQEVRARAAQVRTEGRDRVVAGNRVALNLANVERESIERGDVITRGAAVSRQSFVHARLLHLPGHSPVWHNGTTLELCAGTAHCSAVLDPLWLMPTAGDATTSADVVVPPGREALVRLRLSVPMPVWAGQRIVVRAFAEPADDWSGRTVGGGTIVDPEPSGGRAQRTRWIALGRALDGADPVARMGALVDDAGLMGIAVDALARRSGMRDVAGEIARRNTKSADLVILPGGRVVHDRSLRPLVDRVIATVDRFHAASPLQGGIGRAALEGALGTKISREVGSAAVERAVSRGALRIVDDQGTVARPGKGLHKGGELPGHMKKILDLYKARGITPPTVKEVGDDTGLGARDVLEMITSLQKLGKLVRISADLSLDAETHDDLLRKIREALRSTGTIDVQSLKALTGLSRKFAVPLLEHLDQLQVTLRRGDTRIPGPKLDAEAKPEA